MRINGRTKRAKSLLSMHASATATQLSECYKTCSAEKLRAFEWCSEQFHKTNSWNFKVMSWNTFVFTVGWYFEDPETGEICFRQETPSNTYIIYNLGDL